MTHHKLVIAEMPSVAQSIAAVLGAKQRRDGYLSGNGYLVSWCFGHLAELAGADVYDEKYAKWRYDDLPILPAGWRYTLRADKAKQFELLRDLKFALGNYFEPLMLSVLHYMEMILDDRYLLRRYINCPDEKLSKGGVEKRKNNRRLVSLRDEFESVRKSRQKPVAEG